MTTAKSKSYMLILLYRASEGNELMITLAMGVDHGGTGRTSPFPPRIWSGGR